MYKIIFCDVDGTLLNSEHVMTDATRAAVMKLNIPFVIVSARSPEGIYPILSKNGFDCPIIAFSGAMILDKNRNIVYQRGMRKSLAGRIIDYIEEKKLSLSWNIFAGSKWLVGTRDDDRVRREEAIVEIEACEGTIESLSSDEQVHKILCMCNPDETEKIERMLRDQFPEVNVVRSSDILLEIMDRNVNKADSVERYCRMLGVDIKDTAAIGDNFNDAEMLEHVGLGIIMGNAPKELMARFEHRTDDNDHDGVAKAITGMLL